MSNTTWRVATAPNSSGAIASIDLCGSIEDVLTRVPIASVPIGSAKLRRIGADDVVVARVRADRALIMPHAGRAAIASVIRELTRAGAVPDPAPAPSQAYPEARSEIEALMLDALARAASPLAIDLLLKQPARHALKTDAARRTDSHMLRRLIDPPMVALVGPANIGKSTLVNSLAKRHVSIVADQPGTTRDHVGVMVDCAGLVVTLIDTPGIEPKRTPGGHADIERAAAEVAAELVSRADLMLLCGDAHQMPIAVPAQAFPGVSALTLALRTDLNIPAWTFDVAVSSLTGAGLDTLAAAIRDSLVPPDSFADERPWKFW